MVLHLPLAPLALTPMVASPTLLVPRASPVAAATALVPTDSPCSALLLYPIRCVYCFLNCDIPTLPDSRFYCHGWAVELQRASWLPGVVYVAYTTPAWPAWRKSSWPQGFLPVPSSPHHHRHGRRVRAPLPHGYGISPFPALKSIFYGDQFSPVYRGSWLLTIMSIKGMSHYE
jgi:hypothetical protein